MDEYTAELDRLDAEFVASPGHKSSWGALWALHEMYAARARRVHLSAAAALDAAPKPWDIEPQPGRPVQTRPQPEAT